MVKKYLVNITDCVDIAAHELYAVLTREVEELPDIIVPPIIPVYPEFSVINTNFAVRLMADSYPENSVLMTTINAEKIRPMNVIGRTKKRNIIFIGRNMGSFDWLTRDFGCSELYDLTKHNSGEFISFAGKYITAKIAAAALKGAPLSELGDPIDPNNIVRMNLETGTIVHIDNFGMMKFIGDLGTVKTGDTFNVNISNKHSFNAVYDPRMMSRNTGEWVFFPGSSYGLYELGQTRDRGAKEIGINVGDVINWKRLDCRKDEYSIDSQCKVESLTLRIPSSHHIKEFTEEIIETFNKFGALIIEFQNSNENPRDRLLCLKHIFGTTMPHDRGDEDMISEIAVSEHFSGYLGGTDSVEIPFHTDGTYNEKPPKIVAMHCEEPASNGGVTKLASGKNIYHYLAEQQDQEILNALFLPDALCVERTGRKSCLSIFKRTSDGKILLRYRSEEKNASFKNAEVHKAVFKIREFLENESNFLAFTLQKRQVLIIDNTRILHGRTSFSRDEPRKLQRLLFNGDSSSLGGLKFGFTI